MQTEPPGSFSEFLGELSGMGDFEPDHGTRCIVGMGAYQQTLVPRLNWCKENLGYSPVQVGFCMNTTNRLGSAYIYWHGWQTPEDHAFFKLTWC